jgi:hypothetical protein
MRSAAVLIVLAMLTLAAPPRPTAAAGDLWTHRGHAALLDAAASAKAKQRRLLVGIAGGAT